MASDAFADAATGAPPQPPLEGLHPVLCTPEEERLFSTLLAAVRHSGASPCLLACCV